MTHSQSFFEGKNINPSVSEEQKRNSFFNYGDIETPMYNFFENRMRIAYDSSFYTPEISKSWHEYTATIKKLKTIKYDRDNLLAHDALRTALHSQTADLLVQEGIAPNRKVGRKLLQFMTVSAGLESIGAARSTEADRRNYQITGRFNSRVA